LYKSVVCISGGQDSITTYFAAKLETNIVGLISFDYGQMHGQVERDCVNELVYRETEAGALPYNSWKIVDLSALKEVTVSALNQTTEENVSDGHPLNSSLPASFLPGRNLVMLALASTYAQSIEAVEVWGGMCETDYSGYPDCRDETIQKLAEAIRLGLDYGVDIITPLMFKDKADTFKMAYDLGELEWILEHSHTCYVGDHKTRHIWGYGCGECPACLVRAKGFDAFQIRYPGLA
jgi:7-cyano-7-deazaguanine synthase